MLGAAKFAVFGETFVRFDVTQGIHLSAFFGYDDGIMGSMNPNYLGSVFIGSVYYDAFGDFYVAASGNYPKEYFKSAWPEGRATRLLSSTCTRSFSGGITTWRWATGSKPAVWDGSGVVWCRIYKH